MSFSLKGLYTALITPFDSTGQLDEKGLRQNLRFQLQNDVDGIVLLGSTGETPTLTSKEKEIIIEIGVEEIKGQVPLVVGTGSYSTAQTISNTLLAEKLGADAVLIVSPYYNKPTQEGLYLHFKAISEATNLPVCVYNVQGRTAQNIQTETLERIAKLPHIIGVKEASANLIQINDVIQHIAHLHPHFNVLSGDDAFTFPLMALGGCGIISVVSNLIPKPIKELVLACLKGDFNKARLLHYQMMPIFKAAFIETNPIPIKAAMQMRGMPAGPCRLPLCQLLPENFKQLKQVIDLLPKEWMS